MKNKKIVCLGGGIGTVNLIKGLKEYTPSITVVVSMADEGGSSGRLRRLYNTFPPGDMVSCMAAFLDKNNAFLSNLLTYRFPGDRYGPKESLGGHKLGNLLMVALQNTSKNFYEAISSFQKIFNIPGTFLPATSEAVSISAKTIEGKMIYGEEKIDLGKYNGKRVLDSVYLNPKNVKAGHRVDKAILEANVVMAGPGDLYTTVLPVLIVPEIAESLKRASAKKIFIVNVANKPFETKNYSVLDYIKAIKKHLGAFPFDVVIVNNNYSVKIPKKYKYTYVLSNSGYGLDSVGISKIKLVEKDLVDEKFPLYHASKKLAKVVWENI